LSSVHFTDHPQHCSPYLDLTADRIHCCKPTVGYGESGFLCRKNLIMWTARCMETRGHR